MSSLDVSSTESNPCTPLMGVTFMIWWKLLDFSLGGVITLPMRVASQEIEKQKKMQKIEGVMGAHHIYIDLYSTHTHIYALQVWMIEW